VSELRVEGLIAGYGANQVLHGVAFAVRPGEVVAMLGLNGAGKSVTMRCVAGLLRPWGGRICFGEEDISGLDAEARVERGISMVPQGRGIFPGLTVAQNLRLGGFRMNTADFAARRAAVLQRFPRVAERLQQRAGSMSGGEQAMLAVARALISSPRLLLLDEPSAGLSPAAGRAVFDLFGELRAEGMTILLVEQNVGLAMKLADRVVLMQKGEIVEETAPSRVRDRARLLERLGAGALYGHAPRVRRANAAANGHDAPADGAAVRHETTSTLAAPTQRLAARPAGHARRRRLTWLS
jgi:branched-chain amino acid transport system ATP-binding protein